MPERRRFKRVRKRYPVEFRSGGKLCSGYTHNLSPMGLFICSVFMPKPGAPLSMRMRLPSGKKVLLGVRVVRSYKVPARLQRFVPGGFCVHLQYAPEEYFQFVASLLHVAA